MNKSKITHYNQKRNAVKKKAPDNYIRGFLKGRVI